MTKKPEDKKIEKKSIKKMCRKKMPPVDGAALGVACPKELADMLFNKLERSALRSLSDLRRVAIIGGGHDLQEVLLAMRLNMACSLEAEERDLDIISEILHTLVLHSGMQVDPDTDDSLREDMQSLLVLASVDVHLAIISIAQDMHDVLGRLIGMMDKLTYLVDKELEMYKKYVKVLDSANE